MVDRNPPQAAGCEWCYANQKWWQWWWWWCMAVFKGEGFAWILSFALHNKEAKLLPPDMFLSRKNVQKCVCDRGSAPDPAGGADSTPPNPLAGNGEGPPGTGREKKRRGSEGKRRGGQGRDREGSGGMVREGEGISPRTKILAIALWWCAVYVAVNLRNQ